MQNGNRGKFIVIEGGDGCGKTTVTKHLVEKFGDHIIHTHEPGGNPTAEQIRDVILHPESKKASADTLFLLFWAARIENMEKVIWPAVRSGKHVICDRFDASTWAYQIRAQEHAHLTSLFDRFRSEFIASLKPDLYIFLDVDPIEGKRRALSHKGVEKNHFDERKVFFYERVRIGYLEFLRAYAPNNHLVVNANQPLSKVLSDVTYEVSDFLNLSYQA